MDYHCHISITEYSDPENPTLVSVSTEEFLADLRDTDILIQSHKDLLREFLQHCDLVKFAEHVPDTAEIQQAFDACKRFILETQAPNQVSATV